jgi:hypothetical protein
MILSLKAWEILAQVFRSVDSDNPPKFFSLLTGGVSEETGGQVVEVGPCLGLQAGQIVNLHLPR